jgi:nicotinate-nucleotide adenylyltransferase
MRLGVLGGTFDPPHNGHLALARAAREQLALERVIWVPAGDPWRKAGTTISAAEHRLAMLRLAIGGEDGFEIDTSELEREGPSYTLETLEALHEKYPAHEIVFLLGVDALEDVRNWHEPARLIELTLLGATARAGIQPDANTLERWLPGLSKRVVWFEMPRTDIRATDLRRRSAAGESLAGLVPQGVADYVVRHNLYGGG